ncbi:hypothetical protein [Pseudomonas leptonychotis]|uniref:hypothetical protein n=1 Tax=Pseudomonas leptonychotis TaxID=2448482 RepID=UPI0038667F71
MTDLNKYMLAIKHHEKAELRRLAEAMQGWPNKDAFECDDSWCVGSIHDGELYPVLEIQTQRYDQFEPAESMARFYAAANPASVLALLDEIQRLAGQVEALQSVPDSYQSGFNTKCLACGQHHAGLSGLPCPNMMPAAGGTANG